MMRAHAERSYRRVVAGRHRDAARGAVLLGVLVLVAACSSTGPEEQATEEADAKTLVSAAHAAGVAPGLTV